MIVDPNGVSYLDEWNVLDTPPVTAIDLIGIAVGTPVTDAFNAARAGVKWLIDDWNRA